MIKYRVVYIAQYDTADNTNAIQSIMLWYNMIKYSII